MDSSAQDPTLDAMARFDLVDLSAVEVGGLFARFDDKFLVPAAGLAPLLATLQRTHRALSAGGCVLQPYASRYFDTAGLRCYHDQRRGILPRLKVRLRRYASTGLAFLEVKEKARDGRTLKRRVAVDPGDEAAIEAARQHLLTGFREAGPWHEALFIDFQRVTLLGPGERLTVDVGLTLSQGAASGARGEGPAAVTLPQVAVVELKRADRAARSAALDVLADVRAVRTSFSKYSVGMAAVNPALPRHHLAECFRTLSRLGTSAPVGAP